MPRPRPACPPFADRVYEISDLAHAARTTPHLLKTALSTPDGYVARELLTHPNPSLVLENKEKQALTTALRAFALNQGSIPENLQHELEESAALSDSVITHHTAP
ncbi:hypothetical protein [Streptomyces calidiresistens]|uniref:hypothetical protein n=1 Tax=Streptomyces calidiresistens TaxID=1485586 RepID=UPI0015FDF232|nr:hypothetical protein [Streptomyces calidiresistens]